MLIVLGAGSLSVLCLWFSWRAFQRCRAIHSSAESAQAEDDPLEQKLAEREMNLHLSLAKRNVQALGRAALAGGTGLGFLALTGGSANHILAGQAFALGAVGWAGCRELHRRVGSLADTWRQATNRRRRRQGVDQSERTG